MDGNKTDQISEVRLLHEKIEPFKQLNGFQKHHRVPQTASASDSQFLAKITAADLDADLQQAFSKLRNKFALKRKEISVFGPDDGVGMIVTPHFSYEITVALHDEDPTQVAWRAAISNIQQPEQIFTESFQQIFGNRFSILELLTSAPLDIEAIVDHVEDTELDTVKVDYDKDSTWCEISVATANAAVKVCENSIRVVSHDEVSPRQLLEKFLNVQQQFLASLNLSGNPFLVDSW